MVDGYTEKLPHSSKHRIRPPKELISIMAQFSEKLEGAVSLLETLESKANTELIAATRFVAACYMIKACASDLDMTPN